MFRSCVCTIVVFIASSFAFASQDTIGPNGIMSVGLPCFNGQPLTGAGVAVGQVEAYRPSDPTFDTNAMLNNTDVQPKAVFFHKSTTDFTPDANVPGQMAF